MRKGSVTIYLCLVMTVMVSLVLGCIFSVKVRAGRAQLVLGTDQALFSLLAGYDRKMLDDFDVFFLDGGCGTSAFHLEKLCQRVEGDLAYAADPGKGLWPFAAKSLFEVTPTSVGFTGYTLASDAGGRIFRDAALRYQKETIGIQAAGAAVSYLASLQSLTEVQHNAGSTVTAATAEGHLSQAQDAANGFAGELAAAAQNTANAQAAARSAGNMQSEESLLRTSLNRIVYDDEERRKSEEEALQNSFEKLSGADVVVTEGIGNVMPYLNVIMQSPILGFTLGDASSVLWKSVPASELYGRRGHEQGVGVREIPEGGDSISDKYLYNEYLLGHLGNRRAVEKDAALLCPAEYLVAGRTDDAANVEAVLQRILLMREGVNLLYLLLDPVKSTTLKTTGFTIAVFLGQPEMADTLATGLAAAWAYAESLVDLRGLFLGKRNCLLKDSAHWQLGLADLPRMLDGTIDGLVKGAVIGPDYLDYLRMMLLFEDGEKILARSLDMVELCERGSDRLDFRLDHCLASATVYVEALSERRIKLVCERSLGYREL